MEENSNNKPQMKAEIKGAEAVAEAHTSDNSALIYTLQLCS